MNTDSRNTTLKNTTLKNTTLKNTTLKNKETESIFDELGELGELGELEELEELGESVFGEIIHLANKDYNISINEFDESRLYYNDINQIHRFGDFSFMGYSDSLTMVNALKLIGVHYYSLNEILSNKNWYHPILYNYFKHPGEYLTMNIIDIIKTISKIEYYGWDRWVYHFKNNIYNLT